MREIPPLIEGVEITNPETGTATFVFQKWWQEVKGIIRSLFDTQQQQITDIANAQAAAAAAAAVAGGVAIDLADHEAAVDPHPQYLTQAEGDARYPLSSQLTELTQDTIASTLIAGSNITLTYDDPGNTLTIASTGGGGASGVATVTVPNSRVEWEETVVATGVTGSSKILVSLAPTTDSDENSADLLPPFTISGTPGTNTITFLMGFSEPVSGPIKLNWSAF